jgi:predicted anti-sigma-YlaC factor YlaD
MKHQEIKILLSALVDNEITEHEKIVVSEHLKDCTECQGWMKKAVTLKRNVRSAGNLDLPYAFAGSVSRAIHHKEEVASSWLGIEHYTERFVFGLALLVLLLVGLTNYKQNEEVYPVEHYITGLTTDTAASQILTKRSTVTKDDVLIAVLMK